MKAWLGVLAAGACLAGGAHAGDAPWHGVWIDARYDCPSRKQIKEMEQGTLQQGPHWQMVEGLTCEALHGKARADGALDVSGLCRGIGTLRSKTWRFERAGRKEATVTGLTEMPVRLKHCRG